MDGDDTLDRRSLLLTHCLFEPFALEKDKEVSISQTCGTAGVIERSCMIQWHCTIIITSNHEEANKILRRTLLQRPYVIVYDTVIQKWNQRLDIKQILKTLKSKW